MTDRANMASIVTLTTDFGTVNGYVGAMKGRIMSMNPKVSVVDITHETEPQNVRQAAWCLKRSTVTFPDETVHVVVVDPGVGSTRHAVLIRCRNQWFIGPDNGVLSEIIRDSELQQAYRLHSETRWWQKHRSFDGLALFAPAAACLTNGIDPVELGDPFTDLMLLERSEAVYQDGTISGEIILFDHFGNAITNIHTSLLGRLNRNPDSLEITVANYPFRLVDHYEEGADLKGIALINSDDYLELTVYSGSARDQFALKIGDRVLI